MQMKKILSLILTAVLIQFFHIRINGQESLAAGRAEVAFSVNEQGKKVDVTIGGVFVTSLR